MMLIFMFSLLLPAVFTYLPEETKLNDAEILPLTGIENRISRGIIAQPKGFQYQVRLSIKKYKNGSLVSVRCGGALVSDRAVLTAAHCLQDGISAKLYMGATTTEGNEPTLIMLEVLQKDFVIHEDWNSTALLNDIALIKFPSPIQMNDAVETIFLPPASLINLDESTAIIAGYGKTGTNKPLSQNLRYAFRNILTAYNCEMSFPAYFQKTMHLCLDGSRKTSTCPGDSGDPLVLNDTSGFKVVVGIASFGGFSCDLGLPTVLTRVTSHLDWIHKHTGIPIRK